MDFTPINEVLGLASTAVGLTGKATSTIASVKALFDAGKPADNSEASKLINMLASDLTAANVMNVQLSEALRSLSLQMQREDEFEREKRRYALFNTSQGDFAYKLREEMAEGQPIHFICPVCLNRDKRFSFLRGADDYKLCQADNTHYVQFSNPPSPQRSDDEWSPF
ncbi:hypothetical protein [Sinorhizobium medicae]|uniref:hypothetical protein n=1 Tax=Sinorhizobium medicae TaxID=110321 RepID=UPI000FDBE33D|nr:hypothetical protein [Sinorhizobium medicae]RVJ82705.1 hypothetical protein CN168_10905 [Sinorhizobium medicae]